jgi:hypothetical protein
VEIVKFLIEGKCMDVDLNGFVSLAANYGHYDMLEYLILAGAGNTRSSILINKNMRRRREKSTNIKIKIEKKKN